MTINITSSMGHGRRRGPSSGEDSREDSSNDSSRGGGGSIDSSRGGGSLASYHHSRIIERGQGADESDLLDWCREHKAILIDGSALDTTPPLDVVVAEGTDRPTSPSIRVRVLPVDAYHKVPIEEKDGLLRLSWTQCLQSMLLSLFSRRPTRQSHGLKHVFELVEREGRAIKGSGINFPRHPPKTITPPIPLLDGCVFTGRTAKQLWMEEEVIPPIEIAVFSDVARVALDYIGGEKYRTYEPDFHWRWETIPSKIHLEAVDKETPGVILYDCSTTCGYVHHPLIDPLGMVMSEEMVRPILSTLMTDPTPLLPIVGGEETIGRCMFVSGIAHRDIPRETYLSNIRYLQAILERR